MRGPTTLPLTVNSTRLEPTYDAFVLSLKLTVCPERFAGNGLIVHVIFRLTLSMTGAVLL